MAHSLSKKEMEWFYRVAAIRGNHSGQEADPVYIEFFRALRNQESYDEAALRSAFPVQNFSELKARVRDIIYKAVLFYSQSPEKIRSNDCLQIEWLIDKGFYDEAKKHLKRAKKRAAAEEGFLSHLTLLDLESSLVLASGKVKGSKAWIDRISDDRQEVLEKYHNLQEYIGLYQNIHTKIKSQFTPQGKFAGEYTALILGHPLMGSRDKAKSKRALMYFLRLKYIVEYLQGQFEDSRDLLEQIVSNFEEAHFLAVEYEKEYWLKKYQLAITSIYFGELKSGRGHLQLFHSKRNDHPLHFKYYYTSVMDLMIHTKTFERAESISKAVLKGLTKFSDQIPMNLKYLLWFKVGLVHFYCGNPGGAVKQFRNIIEQPTKNFREDIQGTARILMVLFHYELRDIDAMEYYIRMANQYLSRRKSIFPFERSLLNYFRLCMRTNDPSKWLTGLENLQAQVVALLEEDSSIRAFHFFDYQDWIKRNIDKLKSSPSK